MSTSSTESMPRILTNMCFHQSPVWMEHTESIYPVREGMQEPAFVSPCREAVRLFRKRRGFDAVVTMGARESLAYGWLCLLLGTPSRQIMTEVFIDDPPRPSLLWHGKRLAYAAIARRSLGILTNSTAEVMTMAERFRIPADRLRFVPMHTTIERPEATAPGSFLFAGGRTLRDYPLLIEAIRDEQFPTVIACGTQDLAGIPLPDCVEVHREVDRTAYLDLLKRSAFVVVPLRPCSRSTGQVVVLEAMAFGKAVIATDTPGTHDILRTRENGILVPPGDPRALHDAILQLHRDESLRSSIARKALEDVLDHYGVDAHARAKLAAIRELV